MNKSPDVGQATKEAPEMGRPGLHLMPVLRRLFQDALRTQA
jgi:hypothetical protein